MNTATHQVSFASTKAEAEIIAKIVKRGMAMAKESGRRDMDTMSAHMDVTACHCNGCPLKLQAFLDADDFNFAHDFFGINRHINRETGQLENCFLPRFHA